MTPDILPHIYDTITCVSRTANMISRLVRRGHLPSFPVIQTLVKCVLVPQMVYGFPFIRVIDKSVSLFVATGKHNKGNLYRKLKNAILRPLLYVMGLPHFTHHSSLFIETRLLDIDSLLSLSAAREAHRWLSLDDTNLAASLFREHITAAPRSPFHPFHRICSHITRVPTLHFNTNNTQAFRDIDRSMLREIVWQHQYTTWHRTLRPTGLQHSLPRLYAPRPTTMKLPLYMHLDDPSTAIHRARLRLARARLRSDQHRLGFKDIDTGTCKQCALGDEETVTHMLTECVKFDIPWRECSRTLRRLPLGRELRSSMFPLSSASILECDDYPARLRRHIIRITGKYINALHAAHTDNF